MSVQLQFIRTIGVANSGLFGLSPAEKTQNYVVHPMIRNNWSSADRLRDAMGFVPYIATEEGTSYRYIVEAPLPGSARQPFMPSTASDILYTLQFGTAHFNAGKLLTNGQQPTTEFELVFNGNDWNQDNSQYVDPASSVQAGNMQNLLHQELEGSEYQGVPYFVRYFGRNQEGIRAGLLATDERMVGADENVDPIISPDYINTDIYDHTFEYRRYVQSQNPNTPYNIEVNSIYNFYLDTDPDYESFVGQTQVTEALIPNYYMMEVTRTDQGALGFSPSYPYSAELSPNMVPSHTVMALLGLSHNNSAFNQMISEGYYQYYVNSLGGLSPEELQTLSDTYESQYRDIAILTPEIQSGFLEAYNGSILDDRGTTLDSGHETDDLLAITAYPYYNEIVIPYENQYPSPDGTGLTSEINFYQILQDQAGLTLDQAEKFLTLLQLYICYQYSSPDASLPFNLYDKTWSSNEGTILEENADINLVLHLENMVSALQDNGSELTGLGRVLAEFYDKKSVSLIDGEYVDVSVPAFIPLRPMFTGVENYYFTVPTIDTNGDGIKNAGCNSAGAGAFFNAATGLPSLLLKVASAITSIARYVEEFYEGIDSSAGNQAKSDPLMYVVEKRVIPPGQQSADPSSAPVQTFFFGRDYSSAANSGVRYFDTQIKYGVRYQYDIKQMRLVFGNKYNYTNVTRAVLNVPSFGRALANSLGFFPEPQSLITNTVSHQSVIDKTGIAPRRNPVSYPSFINPFDPVDYKEPIYWTGDFEYLDEGSENGPADPNLGYYGYFIYRWRTTTAGNAFTNGSARMNGVLIDDPNDELSTYLAADLINLQFYDGPGFDGNYHGGAIAGQTMFEAYTSDNEEPPTDPNQDPFGEKEFEVPESTLDLVNALREIEETLGDKWAQETSEWVQGGRGPIDDVLTIIEFAGAGGVHTGGRGPGGAPAGPGLRNLRIGLLRDGLSSLQGFNIPDPPAGRN